MPTPLMKRSKLQNSHVNTHEPNGGKMCSRDNREHSGTVTKATVDQKKQTRKPNQLQKSAWTSFLAQGGEKVKNQSNNFKMTLNLVEELKTSNWMCSLIVA
jgi:hypothetical protein